MLLGQFSRFYVFNKAHRYNTCTWAFLLFVLAQHTDGLIYRTLTVQLHSKISHHLTSVRSIPSAPTRQYTGSPCTTDTNCELPRICYSPFTQDSCSSGETGCFCFSTSHTECTTSADCLSGDRCLTDNVVTGCGSCTLPVPDGYAPVDEGNCYGDSSGSEDDDDDGGSDDEEDGEDDDSDGDSEDSSSNGNSYEGCTSDIQCAPPRVCYNFDTKDSCSPGDTECGCYSASNLKCTTSADCLSGDRCLTNDEVTGCVSCALSVPDGYTAVDEGNCDGDSSGSEDDDDEGASDEDGDGGGNEETDDENDGDNDGNGGNDDEGPNNGGGNNESDSDGGLSVCISVEALSHFDANWLIFREHKQASVLCDQYGNCATPGHLVIYRKKAMMMKTYCNEMAISCVRRIKFVNSPRMKMGLRISSRTKDLEFTALAASKESVIEEQLLRIAVGAGI